MAQAKYLDAADDLRILQGTGEFATLDNERMGLDEYATHIKTLYRNNTLIKARQILDTEQDMQTLNEDDPIGTTLRYGNMTRVWLERQQTTEQAVKHPMVTPEKEEAEPDMSTAEANELATDIAGFLGKALPDDPNMRLLMWQELSTLQKKLKAVEMAMRKQMAEEFFTNPNEGTNTFDMGKEWKLKLTHKINRSPDEASFEGVFAELNADDTITAFTKEDLFKFKPELKKAAYNKLTDKQRNIFDQCLVIKPGSPELKLVPPKEKK